MQMYCTACSGRSVESDMISEWPQWHNNNMMPREDASTHSWPLHSPENLFFKSMASAERDAAAKSDFLRAKYPEPLTRPPSMADEHRPWLDGTYPGAEEPLEIPGEPVLDPVHEMLATGPVWRPIVGAGGLHRDPMTEDKLASDFMAKKWGKPEPPLQASLAYIQPCCPDVSPFTWMHTDLMMAILSSLPRSTLPAVQGVCKCWYFTIRNEPFVGIRRQMCSAPMVLAIGGRADAPQGNGLNHGRVSMLLDSKTWVQAPPLHPCSLHTAVACEEEVYVFGGNHCEKVHGVMMGFPPSCACVKVFSPRTGQWRATCPMPSERSCIGACEADGKIYAFGGFNTQRGVAEEVGTVNMYDPAETNWWILDEMPYSLSSPRCVAVGKKIYVMGGYVDKDGDSHQTGVVQVFNTDRGGVAQWIWRVMEAEMPVSGAVPIVSGCKIFLLGGCSSGDREEGHINRIRTDEMGPPAVWWCPDSAYSIGNGGEGKPFDQTKAGHHLTYGPYRYGESMRLDEDGEEAEQGSDEEDDDFYGRTSDWPPENYPLAWEHERAFTYTDESWCLDTYNGEWTPLQTAPKPHTGEGLYLDGGVIRDAYDPELNYDIETDTWVGDPTRQPLIGHADSAIIAPVLPF